MPRTTMPGRLNNNLRIKIEPRSLTDRVLLPDVISQMEALIAALKAVQETASTVQVLKLEFDGSIDAELFVLEVAQAPIDPKKPHETRKVTYRRSPSAHKKVIAAFREYADGSVKVPDFFTGERLLEVGQALKRNNATMTLSTLNDHESVSPSIVEQINRMFSRKVRSETCVAGQLRGIYDVGGKTCITLVNPSSPKTKMRCLVDEEQAKSLAQHLYRVIEVTGTGTWTQKSFHPASVEAKSFRILQPLPQGSILSAVERMREEYRMMPEDLRAAVDHAWTGTD